MRLYRVSDASKNAEVQARKPTERKFGLLMSKSPRKIRRKLSISLGILTLGSICLLPLQAQEPPSAPTPKPQPASQVPPPIQATTGSQNPASGQATAPQAPNNDAAVTL